MTTQLTKRRVVILGAGGRDFHNFNVAFRQSDEIEVVAFTATQIPGIDSRVYPPVLAGPRYPAGIPIIPEENLPAFSGARGGRGDLRLQRRLARVRDAEGELGDGAGPGLPADVPASTRCARRSGRGHPRFRTGCGKSQTTRRVCRLLREAGEGDRGPASHAYGDLARQGVQRFASVEDLARHECTIEEMEEYEPHVVSGTVIYAGVDYEAILREAEKEADVVVWDGGNNDTSFYRPTSRSSWSTRCAPATSCAITREHEPPDRRRGRDQQDRLGHARAGRRGPPEHRAPQPRAAVVEAASPVYVDGWNGSAGSACSLSRTVRR